MLRKFINTVQFINRSLFKSIRVYNFRNIYLNSQYKASLQQQLISYAQNLPPNSSVEDYTELVKNYLQLSEKSFIEYVKGSEFDPQLLLMFLSTFESSQKIREFLPFLYHKINYFQKKQMVNLLQKILAFKPTIKPRIPHPRPLQQIQSVLVILSELYQSDSLIEWIKFVPLYQGQDIYIVAMGYFSILQKMSPDIKEKNRPTLIKCHKKLCKYLESDEISSQIKIGILLLAFQMNYKLAHNLYLMSLINTEMIDNTKKLLFIINLTKYLSKQNMILSKDQKQAEDTPQHQLNRRLIQLINQINSQNHQDFLKQMKISIYLEIWKALYTLQKLSGPFQKLAQKMAKVTVDKNFRRSVKILQIQEILIVLECMAKHKINNERLLKLMLVLSSPHLHIMNKNLFIRFLKCLVTYVRQCEEYLINTRKILEERKLQFTQVDAQQINQILKRVMILFPKAFKAGS